MKRQTLLQKREPPAGSHPLHCHHISMHRLTNYYVSNTRTHVGASLSLTLFGRRPASGQFVGAVSFVAVLDCR